MACSVSSRRQCGPGDGERPLHVHPRVSPQGRRDTSQPVIPLETLRAAPKVLLHDHLDGGLRPATVVELARDLRYTGLPTTDARELARWFHASAASGSLALYLRGFAHTIAVMQSPESIERVAYECDAVARGFERAESRYAITLRQIVCAMRNRTDSLEMAQLAVANRDRGVVGFDIAGEEAGYPPEKHLAAFQLCHRENFSITIHAGEGFGPASIWQAIQICGAHRIGHGVRLVEDMTIEDAGRGTPGREATVTKLGLLASYVRDKRIPLEICPSSNVDTGAAPSLDAHAIRYFLAQKFRVTVNTDNRLMSDITLSEEFRRLSEVLPIGLADVEKLTINAMKSAFVGYDERLAIIYDRIKPGYAKLRGEPALAGFRLPPSA
ncbi:MAG: adenosine deaminase family protein [Chloroflexi bacterium]|nr:MAG: adenosine deaminase family protein [Chloroflexota bacterium]